MAMQDFWNELVKGFGNAIADVRTKLVEEGWFGKALFPANKEGTLEVVEMNAKMERTTTTAKMHIDVEWTSYEDRKARGWQEPVQPIEPGPDKDKGIDR